MNEGQLIQRRYSTTAWLCAIFFGFPFAPLLMLVGLSSPQQRQRIGTRYIVWTTVIGYLALFVILIPTRLPHRPITSSRDHRPTLRFTNGNSCTLPNPRQLVDLLPHSQQQPSAQGTERP